MSRCRPVYSLTPMRTLLCLWSVFYGVYTLQAQNYYSTDRQYLKSKTEGNNLLNNYRSDYPDTSITTLHEFFPRNVLGNFGLASIPLKIGYHSSDLGFRFFDAPTRADRIHEEDIVFYHSKGPFADLTGIAGSKQLQIFKLNFTHTLKGRNNIGLKLNRYNSVGYYRKQQSFVNNILFTNSNQSRSGRAGYYAYFLANLNKNRENGGLKDSVLNDSTVWLNKGIMDVRLDSAARENREFKIMFNPWIRLNRKSDSSGSAEHFLSLKSAYGSHKYRYKDQGVAQDDFYEVNWYDSLKTNDSAHVKKFSNSLDYLIRKGKNLSLSFGLRNEYNALWQSSQSHVSRDFYNQLLQGALQLGKDLPSPDSSRAMVPRMESRLEAQLVGWGLNRGNLKIESKSQLFNTPRFQRLYLDMLYEIRRPDEIYRQWNSNHFIWNTDYADLKTLQGRLGILLNAGLGLELLAQWQDNFVYFDEAALPRQYGQSIQNLVVNLRYERIFFKHLGFALHYAYQNTSAPAVLRVPEHTACANLFLAAALFKNNLLLQLGGQLQAYQSFETYAYMPATQVFHLQKGFVTGNYPFLDLYLNVRIRPASFFVKIENVLAGTAGNNFALIPGYYQPQTALRFGLKWMFFD